jgi:hypothetical protein
VGEALAGAVVATVSMSADADCDNGTIALYGTPRYRCRVGGYTLVALKRLACQTTDEVEDESRSPQTCDIHQGESICTLSTCCDRAYVFIGLVGTLLPYLDRVIQDAGYGLRRMHLLRGWVNKLQGRFSG